MEHKNIITIQNWLSIGLIMLACFENCICISWFCTNFFETRANLDILWSLFLSVFLSEWSESFVSRYNPSILELCTAVDLLQKGKQEQIEPLSILASPELAYCTICKERIARIFKLSIHAVQTMLFALLGTTSPDFQVLATELPI